jgi:hypothetical protein
VDFKAGVYLRYWVIPVNNIYIYIYIYIYLTSIRFNNSIKSNVMACDEYRLYRVISTVVINVRAN